MDVQCYQCYSIQCHGLQVLSHLVGLLGYRLGWHRQHILIQTLLPVYLQEGTQPPFRKPSQR